MSGISKRGPGGSVIGALQGALGGERCYCADMLQVPEGDWPVSADAPPVSDTQSATGNARAFAADEERGVGFAVRVPPNVTKLNLRLPGRILDGAPDERQVVLRVYARVNGVWSGASALGILHLPNDLAQSSAHAVLLAPIGVSPGDSVQFLVTRNPLSASDTLEGRWGLYEVGVNFA